MRDEACHCLESDGDKENCNGGEMVGTGKSAAKPRGNGRRAMLVYLKPEQIKQLKVAALEENKNVYDVVDEAAEAWLKKRAKRLQKLVSDETGESEG